MFGNGLLKRQRPHLGCPCYLAAFIFAVFLSLFVKPIQKIEDKPNFQFIYLLINGEIVGSYSTIEKQ